MCHVRPAFGAIALATDRKPQLLSHPTRSPSSYPQPSPELVARFAAIVGPQHTLTDPDAQSPYLREWRDRYVGRAAAVLRPGSTAEVAAILKLAGEHGVAVVPQSGNTGLVGGQIPFEAGNEVVLSLARMKAIRAIEPSGASMIVEAGVTLAEAQAAAESAGRYFPLSLPSEGTAQVGGALATNAGGVAVLAYGNARAFVLGLEVVLADGRVWNGLKTLKKDNTGYDLKNLFVGSEGTLGIITAAALKLYARPAEKATALVSLQDTAALTKLFRLVEARGGTAVTAFEFMSDFAMRCVTKHVPGARLPFAEAAPWFALIELSSLSEDGSAAALMETLLTEAAEQDLVTDAVIAQSLSQARDFWRLREELSDAQKHEGGSIKHDVSVPISDMAEFIARADAVVAKVCPGARPMPFGHFGDGNVHYNVTQPEGMDKAAYLALWDPMQNAVHEVVAGMNGSISAEHGIGRMKRHELPHVKSDVEMDLMRRIKSVLDPNGILNPGKVL
jgi:FAD/FMN-containing dehydrogenase